MYTTSDVTGLLNSDPGPGHGLAPNFDRQTEHFPVAYFKIKGHHDFKQVQNQIEQIKKNAKFCFSSTLKVESNQRDMPYLIVRRLPFQIHVFINESATPSLSRSYN